MPIHATTIVFNLVALPLLLQLLAPTYYHHPHGQPRIQFANAHGFLSSPRSRNVVAFEDRKYYPITADDPQPEDCPNCLDHGGVLARCGVMGSGQGAMERNYDLPKNALGEPMKPNPQQTYIESSTIEIEILLTAHHKGHFTFKGCAITSTTESPTQECFDAHPLTFISDEYYGAVPDAQFPERVYVAPQTIQSKIKSDKDGFQDGMAFKYKLQLPKGLVGELVLLQWYYVASNSGCVHEGYDDYDWPWEWIQSVMQGDGDEEGPSVWDEKMSVGKGNKPCADVLSPDGDGVPEQFWNCAEVTILPENGASQQQNFLSSVNTSSSKTIIGYYGELGYETTFRRNKSSWQWYDRNKLASPQNMDFTKYTRINFAFFQTDVQGNLWGTDSWADPNLLFGPYNWNPAEGERQYCSWDTPTNKVCNGHFFEQGLIHLVQAAEAEIYPSIGGWSLSDPFPAMAANADARLNFANKCIELIEEYGFDGIDIDWEYPGYADHSGTPEDTVSYNQLLSVLRLKLDELGHKNGRFYGLTAALPCGTNNINNIDIETAAKYLTELNLMTYDFFGSWSPTTGTNAPLYDQDWGDDDVKDFSVDGCVRNWIKGGGSPSAINIGLPFYGRSFLRAKGLNEPHEGNDKNTWFWDDGSPQYFNIVEKLPELVSVRHELTKTQYAYKDNELGGMVSYDDEEAICDKTEYCINNDLNGFIIWEISGDVMQDLSTPLIDAMHAKLRDPSLDCKSLAYDPNAPPKATGLQNSISDQGVPTIAIPISAPTTPAPTMPLICPADHTGPLQHAACSGFYYCVNGNPYYPPIPCPEGMLFDESNSLCNLPARVTCSETLSPISAPTNMPTREPTVNLPIYSPPSSLADSTLNCSEGFTGPLPYNDCAEYYYCMNGNPYYPTIRCPPGTIFDENYLTCYDSSRASCPNSAQIQNGSTNTGVTAGDTADSTPKATEDEEGIKNESFQYGGNSGGNNGNEEGVDENLSDQSNEDNDVAYNIGSNSEEQEGSTETLSGQNDNGNPDEAYDDTNKEETANPSASSEGDDSVHSSPASEPDIQSTSPPASAQDVSVQSDETPTTQNVCGVSFNVVTENCMFGLTVTTCNKGDPPCPKGQGCYENVQCGDQVSSSSSTNHVSTVENGSNTVDDKASDDVYENNDDVSLTIIMKLGDYPNDIGWSLIAFDGSINVAKPPGTYESLKPNATVYETISIPLSLWVNSIRLTLTISSISGNGLCCSNGLGYYKIYEGILEEGLPLAEGGEFEYYTSKTIVITDNGIVLILDDDPPVTVQNFTGQDLMDQDYTDNIVGTEQQVVQSEPSNDSTSPQPNLIDSPEQQKVSSSQTNMMNSPESFSPESFDLASFTQAKTQNETEENSKKSVLITVMISVIIVAFVIGSILLYTAQKRKIAKCDQSLAHFPDDNDSLDWSEHGAWNVGEDEIAMQADPLFYDIENSCHSDTQVNNDVQESYARHSSTGSQQSSSKKPRRHSSTGSQSSSKSRRRSSAGSTADSLTPDTEVPTVNNTEPDKIIPGDMSDITDGFECFGNTITAADEEEEEEEANNTNNKDQGQYDFESQSDDNKSQSDDDDDGGLSTIFSGDEESNYGQEAGTFA